MEVEVKMMMHDAQRGDFLPWTVDRLTTHMDEQAGRRKAILSLWYSGPFPSLQSVRSPKPTSPKSAADRSMLSLLFA